MHKCWNVLLEVLWSLQHNDDDDEDNDDDDEDDDEDDVEYHGWSKHVGEWIGRVAEIAEHKEHDKDDKEMLLIVIMMMTIINYYDIDNMIWKVSTKLERSGVLQVLSNIDIDVDIDMDLLILWIYLRKTWTDSSSPGAKGV